MHNTFVEFYMEIKRLWLKVFFNGHRKKKLWKNVLQSWLVGVLYMTNRIDELWNILKYEMYGFFIKLTH